MKSFLSIFLILFLFSNLQSQNGQARFINLPANFFTVTGFYDARMNNSLNSYQMNPNQEVFVIYGVDTTESIESIIFNTISADSSIAAYEVSLYNISRVYSDSLRPIDLFFRRGNPFARLKTFTENQTRTNSGIFVSQDTLQNFSTNLTELSLALPKRTLIHVQRISHAAADKNLSWFNSLVLVRRKND